jgi:DNA invertase Pin-like site-specific DNA recombinase
MRPHISQRKTGFRLPPDVSFEKQRLSGAWVYVFRHRVLGELGRILLQELDDGRCHISCEVVGDPSDPMTTQQTAIFKPLGLELTREMESTFGATPEVAGCEKIFREQVSSVTVRLQLQSALEFVRDGDVFVVTKLDRLARSVADLMAILQALERKRVAMRILNLGMDTQTPTGKLMVTLLGGVAQFEREMMLERQREGIAKAKSAGKYKGRKPIAPDRHQHFLRLAAEGATKISIARQLGIGEATVYRILAIAKE